MKGQVSVGVEMAHVMATGALQSRRSRQIESETAANASPSTPVTAVEAILSHPPRPRKKSRR
jgi:hypothetical protein